MSPSDWATKDFYEVLGVAKDASADQIKKAYRKLARANHPDSNQGDAASEERFKSISEAYSVLSDTDKRKDYDEQRELFASGGFRMPNGQAGGDFSDMFGGRSGGFSDLFGGMFGGGGGGTRVRTSQARRGQDVEAETSLSFEDAIDGQTVSIQLASDAACAACAGTGARAGTMPHVCPTCQGSGMVVSSQGGVFSMTEPCRDCRGRGLVVDDPCPVCHGSGRGTSTRTVRARIPAGARNGQRIRLRGKGVAGEHGGPAGDLYITVHVRPHKIFGRKGDNLTVEVPVRFDEVALGADISVPTLEGRPVTLRVPAGTDNGRTFRVKGRGSPRRDGTFGDLLVTVNVETPKSLDEAAKSAVEALRTAIGEQDPRAALLRQAGRSHV